VRTSYWQDLSILLFPTAATPLPLLLLKLKEWSWDFGHVSMCRQPGIDSELDQTREYQLCAEARLGKGVMLGEIVLVFPHFF
jgi:hypothetical protein